ncbi:hypothetical protein MJO29_010197 [Puccinia striiformis f. sp. tritici]|nr:hypothetical protein MJO29_010197 [Puccinia striiformis f. sp. tritici]
MDIDTIEEPKRCPSEEIFQCLDENIVQAKDGTWHLLAIDRYLKPPVRCQVPTNRSKVPPTSSKHLPSGPNNLEEFCSCTQTRNRYQVPSLVQAKLRLMSPSPIPSEQLVPMNQPGDRESGKVKTEVTQAPPAADSDPSALPNKDVFQCLDKDIKEAKLKLQSAKPIPAKRASIPVEQPSKPLSPTRIFPNIPPGAKKTEAAQAPKTANSNLPSSGRSLQHPKVQDDDCCHFTSLTFDFRVNTYTQAKRAPFPVEQPSKPISPWILPTEGSCGTKTEATQALYTAHSSALALPSIRPSPDPVKIKENACTHPTSPPSPPQLVIVLDTPTAVDSSALASPSIRTSPDPVKVEENVCTHPTYLPSLPQLAVVLDTPTAADAQASALPSSQPSPDHVKVEEDRHTHPISPPSPPQLAVVLDTLTAADSIVPALPRSTPSPQLIVASAAWEDNTSTTVSEDTVRGGPADVPSAAYADANETYHPLESSSSADTVTRRPADDVPSAVYPHWRPSRPEQAPRREQGLDSFDKIIDFPFTATGYFHKKLQAWFFTCKEPRHNHPPSEYAAAQVANRKLTPALFIKMENLGSAGLKPQGILTAMKKTHPNEKILATISTIYTTRKKSRLQSLQGLSPIAHLNKTLLNTDFTTTTKVNDEGVLKALFFCHTRSVELLTAYPHIILLHCTYKTNKYNMPLLHISGITGANKTFSIVFCFMAEETESFYDWALQALVTVLESHKIPFPAVVITDREQALMNSLATTFPDAKRMLCAWHIQKNLLAKASKLIKNPAQEKDMLNYWFNIVKIRVRADFLSSFSRFSNKYGAEFEKYVIKTWLPVAEYYSNAWTNNIAHFNNRTTSRMESAHAFIKSHLLGPQHGFTSVIKLISNALESQYHKIATKFHQQKMTSLQYLGSIFRECKGIITNYALRKAYNNLVEAKKAKKEGEKLGQCNQHYGVRMGIPCKHRMAEILGSGEPISPDEFHEQWHLKSIRTVLRTNSDKMMAKIEDIKDKLVGMNPAQMAIQLAAINRILEGTGTVIDIKLPTEAQKTRRRPGGSKNKPKTTKRDESESEHVEKKRKNEEKQAGKVKKQKMAEDKKQAVQKKTSTLKKRVLPTRKGKSGAPIPEETSDEEAISDKEASMSEEEDSTSEEEEPATKKQSQPKKPANTLRPM